MEITAESVKEMPVHQLGRIARRDWKEVYFGAEPYLNALGSMDKVSDNYGMDDGRSIVLYFLSNASTWRGPVAKIVKAELKRRVGVK